MRSSAPIGSRSHPSRVLETSSPTATGALSRTRPSPPEAAGALALAARRSLSSTSARMSAARSAVGANAYPRTTYGAIPLSDMSESGPTGDDCQQPASRSQRRPSHLWAISPA